MKTIRRCFAIALAATALLCFRAQAGIVYVDVDASGTSDGSSWSNAYTSLQSALTNATAGSDLWVAEGAYVPGTERTDAFVLRDGVALYGGFAGTETNRNERDWAAHRTMLSGDVGVQGQVSDNSYHVLIGSDGAVLDGFTVTAGMADGPPPHLNGGGIYSSNSSPVLVNCAFTSNATGRAGSGGAVLNLGASPTFSNCTFEANHGYWGGAVCNMGGGTPLFTDCEFQGNVGDYGGGINNEGCSPIIQNCVFRENAGDGGAVNNRDCAPSFVNSVFLSNSARRWDGGAIRSVAAAPTFTNCLFVWNGTEEGCGGAVYAYNASPELFNCTTYGNVAAVGSGGGLYAVGGISVVWNSILWSNTAPTGGEIALSNGVCRVGFTTCEGAINGPKFSGLPVQDAGGNLDADPQFLDRDNPEGADGTFSTLDDGLQLDAQIAARSPCIDSASVSNAPASDITGLARPQFLAIDMGAYEYDTDFDDDGLPNLIEYQVGSNAHNADSDGDGINDGDEYYIYGTSPTSADTDGDGMPDDWEIAHGLNPTVADAGQDLDLDWITNIEEYNNGLDPSLPDSNADGTNDYVEVHGEEGVRYHYDKIDRLVGAEHTRGVSFGYRYDGNGNILRQIALDRDQDGDGLLDLWEFLNGVSWTNASGADGMTGDLDGDGWSNGQEAQAGTSATDPDVSPGTVGRAPDYLLPLSVPFVPDRLVMAAGDLLPGGADELVIAADGTPSVTGQVYICEQSGSGWQTTAIPAGRFGITSLRVGQLTNDVAPCIYAGLRVDGGSNVLGRFVKTGDTWEHEIIFSATGTAHAVKAGYILGILDGEIVAALDPEDDGDMLLYSLEPGSNSWSATSLDTNAALSGAGGLLPSDTNSETRLARLLTNGDVKITADWEMGATGTIFEIDSPLAVTPSDLTVYSSNGLALCGSQLDGTSSRTVEVRAYDVGQSNVASLLSWSNEELVDTSSGDACVAFADLEARDSALLFFTHPGGGVYFWDARQQPSPVRQHLWTPPAPRQWSDLTAFTDIGAGEGLAGVCAATNGYELCIWLPGPLTFLSDFAETPPSARIMAEPNSGGGFAEVQVTVWDAEGNPSLPAIQYQDINTSNWLDSTLLSIDGMTYSLATTVEAMPTGTLHSLTWHAAADLGAEFTNSLWLRSRAVDYSGWGNWSEPALYRIESSNDSDDDDLPDDWEINHGLSPFVGTGPDGSMGDPDGDGVPNIDEHTGDTDPLDGDSYVGIIAIQHTNGGIRVVWKGGEWATQYLECREDLASTAEQWSAIFTNVPKTAITNWVIDAGATNETLFYRIKAERP